MPSLLDRAREFVARQALNFGNREDSGAILGNVLGGLGGAGYSYLNGQAGRRMVLNSLGGMLLGGFAGNVGRKVLKSTDFGRRLRRRLELAAKAPLTVLPTEMQPSTIAESLVGSLIGQARMTRENGDSSVDATMPEDYRALTSDRLVGKLRNASARNEKPKPWNGYLYDSIRAAPGSTGENLAATIAIPAEYPGLEQVFISNRAGGHWGKVMPDAAARAIRDFPANPSADGWVPAYTY